MKVGLKFVFGSRLNVPNLNRSNICVILSPIRKPQQRCQVGRAQLDVVFNQHHTIVALLVEKFSTSTDELAADAQIFRASHNGRVGYTAGFNHTTEGILFRTCSPVKKMMDVNLLFRHFWA